MTLSLNDSTWDFSRLTLLTLSPILSAKRLWGISTHGPSTTAAPPLHLPAPENFTCARDEALRLLVNLAQPGGFLRVFVDLGPPMLAMLLHLGTATVRPILAAFPRPKAQPAPADGTSGSHTIVEPLTGRELEILALLRRRLSDKEIARRLGPSAATVKPYAVHIYGKLGVGKRRNAVIKAETLGILPRA